MNGVINKWMNEWMNECKNEWMHKWMNKWIKMEVQNIKKIIEQKFKASKKLKINLIVILLEVNNQSKLKMFKTENTRLVPFKTILAVQNCFP